MKRFFIIALSCIALYSCKHDEEITEEKKVDPTDFYIDNYNYECSYIVEKDGLTDVSVYIPAVMDYPIFLVKRVSKEDFINGENPFFSYEGKAKGLFGWGNTAVEIFKHYIPETDNIYIQFRFSDGTQIAKEISEEYNNVVIE